MKNLKTAKAKRSLIRDNRGSAMITAIVVGVVMAVFALSLLVVTYSLYAQSAKRTGLIQCRYLAEGMADDLASELKDNESQLYKVLKSHVYKVRPGNTIHTGSWKAVGVNASEAFETLEYSVKPDTGDRLEGYEFYIVFRYSQGSDDTAETEVAGGDTEYDATDLNESDLGVTGDYHEDYDDMASNDVASGGGDCTVMMDVTCSRGDSSCTISREVEDIRF